MQHPEATGASVEMGPAESHPAKKGTHRVLYSASKAILGLAVVVTACLLAIAFPGTLQYDTSQILTVVLFVGLRVVVDLRPAPSSSPHMAQLAAAVDFALLMLVGTGGAAVGAGVGAVVRSLLEGAREHTVHPLVSIARAVVAVGFAGVVYLAAGGEPGRLLSLATASLGAIVAAALTYAVVDATMAVVGTNPSWTAVTAGRWLRHSGRVALQYAGLLALGLGAAIIFAVSPTASLLLLLPLGVAYYTLRTAVSARQSIRLAVESLALEIDRRESYTAQHSQRVAEYARKVCRELQLGAQETELIADVAKIHDLGKMNLWPEMLNKAGPLDDGERLEMNRHPAYGAEILAGFVDYRHACEIIMHHHERYDGKGYPAGLRGDQIPLGSRIVAVVDAFDAMTSDRPYRDALSFERALEELQANAGAQFDPLVVEAFVAAIRPEDVRSNAESAGDRNVHSARVWSQTA